MKSHRIYLLTACFLFSCASNAATSVEPSEDHTDESTSSVSSEASRSSSSSSSSSSEAGPRYDRSPLNEPMIGRQYYLNHIGDIYSVWDQYRGDGITIAVIDRGFDASHEEFAGKIDAESGYYHEVDGQTRFDKGASNLYGDESHGTFCAGVAAAAVNGKGVAGVAPNAKLMLLKTDGRPRSICAAMRHAADKGARVISISIGAYYGYQGSDDLVDDGSNLADVFDTSVEYCYNKKVPVISAGGNSGQSQPHEYTWPGATPLVIGVGGLAANSSEEIWSGSSYNSSPEYEFIDVLAPSDMMYGCCDYGSKYDGGWDGTSFAAPQVAGLAALYFQKNPDASAADFERDLRATCHKMKHSEIANENQLGSGRVDAGHLLGIACGAKSVNVKARSNEQMYCYAYNVATDTENAPWPGVRMDKTGNDYVCNVATGTYEFVILNNGIENVTRWQSVDLLVTSFQFGHVYNCNSSTRELGKVVGNYL